MFHDAQDRAVFFDGIRRYASKGVVRFHTPGHRGGRWLWDSFGDALGPAIATMDVSDVLEGDRNVSSWTQALSVSQQQTADLFGAAGSRYLINGTSGGIHVAVMALASTGPVFSNRASHLSVYAACMLNRSPHVTIAPDYDSYWDIPGPPPIEQTLNVARQVSPEVYVETYPNYYGIAPPLQKIVEGLHHTRIIADEAHGSHFLFTPGAPVTALASGAHVTVQSFHKTLGALTQASVLHIHKGHGELIPRVDRSLFLLQSTSASPILLSSLEAATLQAEKTAHQDWQYAVDLAQFFRLKIHKLGVPVLTEPFVRKRWGATLDPTRVIVHVGELGWTGAEADEHLRRVHRVQVEMANQRCLVFLISPGNSEADVIQAIEGLKDLEALRKGRPLPSVMVPPWSSQPVMKPWEALETPITWLPLSESVGRICAEVICPYPPGIPVISPGEEVTAEIVEYLLHVRKQGFEVRGAAHSDLGMIGVVS